MKRQSAFLTLELLIVFAIAAVLAALSLPHYLGHHIKANRLRAEAALLHIAGNLEDYYAEHKSYEGANLDNLLVPKWIGNGQYHLVIVSVSKDGYEIAAVPDEQQAKEDEICGTLKLNSQGLKSISGSGTVQECW